MAATSGTAAPQMTHKQLMKLQNRLLNEQARLTKLTKLASVTEPPLSTKSKGARRRANKAKERSQSDGPRFPTSAGSKPGFAKQTITNDELITNVRGSDVFRANSLYVNPGLPASFPWLSQIAKQYEKYQFKTLYYMYKPTVSGYATAGQTGKVMLSLDYDASDNPPASKVQVMDTWPHSDKMPYEVIRLVPSLPAMHQNGPKFIRTAAPPAGSDIKTYDAGLLSYSTEGTGVLDALVGELHVFYVVDLMVPVLESTAVAPKNFNVSTYGMTSPQSTPDDTTTPVDFDKIAFNGNALELPVSSTNPETLTPNVTDFKLPVGNYIVTVIGQFNVDSVVGNGSVTFFSNIAQSPVPAPYQPSFNAGGNHTLLDGSDNVFAVNSQAFIASNGEVSFSVTFTPEILVSAATMSFLGQVTIHRV
jgi:hypothetical protein